MDEHQLERDSKRIRAIKAAVKALADKKAARFIERRRELEHKLYLKDKGVEL